MQIDDGFYWTFKELKQSLVTYMNQQHVLVFTEPLRNWNTESPVAFVVGDEFLLNL